MPRRRTIRRLRGWTSPLTEVPADGISSIRHSSINDSDYNYNDDFVESPTRRRSNRSFNINMNDCFDDADATTGTMTTTTNTTLAATASSAFGKTDDGMLPTSSYQQQRHQQQHQQHRRQRTALSSSLRQLRTTMSGSRRIVRDSRDEARLAVQEARDIRNQVHSAVQGHLPLEDDLDFSSSSSLSLISDNDDEEDEELNRFLRSFLRNLIEEASPIHPAMV